MLEILKNPLVSVIVPCYNLSRYLSEALNSVLNQTYHCWECIIVDDGSIDDTKNVASSFCYRDTRFRYYYQSNHGLAYSRRVGIANSRGQLILPLDADDYIDDSYLEKAVSIFQHKPETKLVYCRAALFGDENGEWKLGEYSYDSLLWSNCIFCSALYKKSDYDKTFGYNPNMVYGWEDWDFWLSLLDEDSVVEMIGEVLFHYRVRHRSMHFKMVPHLYDMCVQIYNNHRDKYIKCFPEIVYYHNIQQIKSAEIESKLIEMQLMVDEMAYKIVEKEKEIRSSYAYRIGKMILMPISVLTKLLRIR